MTNCNVLTGLEHKKGSFSKDQVEVLRELVGIMIPASQEYTVPGADDEIIFEAILVAAQVDLHLIEAGLRSLDTMSKSRYRKEFIFLDKPTRQKVVHEFLQSAELYVIEIINVTLQCYYSDDRVMTSLDMEARSPFPIGYEVEQGDWSLLDLVKRKAKIYRKA